MVRMGLNVEYGVTSARDQFGLGADVAGTVAALGEGVTRFAVGDPVVAPRSGSTGRWELRRSTSCWRTGNSPPRRPVPIS